MTTVAIAAPHDEAVTAAEDAVRAGGNALDASLAAAAMLAVTYPHQCSSGGDLTALVRLPGDSEPVALLSIGAAPAGLTPERVRRELPEMPRQGPLTVTVPGVVAGWMTLAASGARLGLARALERAAVAAEGHPVSRGLARALTARQDAVLSDPGLKAVLAPAGRPLAAGEMLRQPALARTLEDLVEDPDSFYRGEMAARLARGLERLGSPIGAADLRAHEPELVAPLSLDAAGARWWAAPPPAQGVTALALLADGDGRDLLTRALSAHTARDRLLGDPRGGPIDIAEMLDSRTGGDAVAVGSRAAGDTVAISAMDDEGRVVVLIQSVYQTLGAGLLEPETGIVLHNRGSAFRLPPDTEDGLRDPGGLKPGLRPPHTLCPLIAEAPGCQLALGCQGGRAQPLILAQVARRLRDGDASLGDGLAAPRWVIGSRDIDCPSETLLHEPGSQLPPSPGPLALLSTQGPDDRCGHVQATRRTGRALEAATDPRADGRAAVVNGR